jgi:uncharacterized protein YqgC (DUF456 family)
VTKSVATYLIFCSKRQANQMGAQMGGQTEAQMGAQMGTQMGAQIVTTKSLILNLLIKYSQSQC